MHDINERPILDLDASQLVAGNMASRAAVAAAKQEFERASKDRSVDSRLHWLELAIEHPLKHVRDCNAECLLQLCCSSVQSHRGVRGQPNRKTESEQHFGSPSTRAPAASCTTASSSRRVAYNG